MEEYEDIGNAVARPVRNENNPEGQKNELSSQSGEMVQYHRQELESEGYARIRGGPKPGCP